MNLKLPVVAVNIHIMTALPTNLSQNNARVLLGFQSIDFNYSYYTLVYTYYFK